MRPATISDIKRELKNYTAEELAELCLHLSKFKKENKELLTYLLYEAADEDAFILGVKDGMDEEFGLINKTNYYYIKKSARKILRSIKKYIRFSKKKETEVALLMHFCIRLKNLAPSLDRSVALKNLYQRQVLLIEKAISTLHEDLQYDYLEELKSLK